MPPTLSQMSVLPFGSRLAPDMMKENSSSFLGAVYDQTGSRGPNGSPGARRVIAARVDGENDLVDRRVIARRPAAAVVEDEDVPCAGIALGDPLGVVLGEQSLIGLRAGAVGERVAPAVEEVASLAALPARVAAASAVVVPWSMIQNSPNERTLIMI